MHMNRKREEEFIALVVDLTGNLFPSEIGNTALINSELEHLEGGHFRGRQMLFFGMWTKFG